MKELVHLATPKIWRQSIKIIVFLAAFGFAQNIWATTISSTSAGGDWSNTGTWVGGVVPTSGDDVTIVAGATVVIRSPYFFSTPAVCNSLTIDGTLTMGSGSGSDNRLDVMTFIHINNGGNLNHGGNAVHNIFISGNFINNGTFNAIPGNAGSIKFTFNGTASQVVSSTATNINFADIALNLTAGQSLSFGGSITYLTVAGTITQTTGDFVSPSNLWTLGDLKLYAGNFTAGDSTILTGNFSNSGTAFNAGSGTVVFSGITQAIDGSISTTFNDLMLRGSTTTSVNQVTIVGDALVIRDDATLTINNQIQVNGATTVGSGIFGNLSIASASGSKIFKGLVTINSGATWSNSANTNVHFEGGLANAGTFNSGSGIHFFETNAQSVSGVVSVPTADVSISLTNNETFSVASAIQGAGSVTQGANSVLNIGGTIGSSISISATASGNTVNYTGGAQSVKGINYVNLGLSGSGVKILTTNTTVISGNLTFTNGASATTVIPVAIGGNLSVGDGCSYTIAHTDINIAGTTTVGGGASGSLTISDAAGTKTFVGLVTIASGATWDNSIGGNAHLQNGIINNGTFTGGSGTYFFETNNQSVGGSLTMNKIAVASGITLTNNATLTVTTDLSAATATWVQGANATLNIGGSCTFLGLNATTAVNTINYTGASQTVKGFSYYNLGLTGTGTVTLLSGILNITDKFTISGTVTAASANAMIIGGDFFIADGSQFTISGFDFSVGGKTTIGAGASGVLNFTSLAGIKTFTGLVTVKSGATWNNSINSAITFQGGLTNSGTFTPGTGTYTFDTNAQNITGTYSLANVVINTITLTNNNSLTIGTSISGTGIIKQGNSSTLIINGTSTVSSINGTATGNSVTYNSASPTIIGGSYYNLTLNQSSGDATLAANSNVQNILTLSTGNLDLGAFNLALATTASISIAAPSASTMIITSGVGELRKLVAATGSFTFPVGDNTGTPEYSPVTVNVTSASGFSSAHVGVRVVNAKHPSNASSTDYLSRYWTVRQQGITGCTANISGSYLLGDVAGTESNILAAQLDGTFNQTSNGWKKFSAINTNLLTATSVALTSLQTSGFTGISKLTPTVSITGGGVTVCAGSPVQLGANTTGTPSFAYSWSPSTGLSSTTIANPTATISTGVTYTLTVYDGNGFSASDVTTININSPAAKPTISATGLNSLTPTLMSSSATGNQWFKDGSSIAGATNQTYQADANGSYTVQVTGANGCASPMSDFYNLVITGIENTPFGGNAFVFPVPADKQLNINLESFIPESVVEIRIYDMLGRAILTKGVMSNENVIDVSHLAAGQFIIQAFQQNQFRAQRFSKK